MPTYTVKKNDTLSGIAAKHGVTLSALLKANPKLNKANLIRIGQQINIPAGGKVVKPKVVESSGGTQKTPDQKAAWVKMKFDGKTLSILSYKTDRLVLAVPSISGLPAHSKRLRDLITKEKRTDLDLNKDYTGPDSQDVKDAGPIPEDDYSLKLTKTMSFQKTSADGQGWGVGGWRLNEDLSGRWDNLFGGRSGFFLHHDGGQRGTSGCIGVKSGTDIERIKKLLIEAHKNGQESVNVEVDYD
ncbi:LysM peptidoglycan-binding domain-containing protein [Archangium lipolyticum]|uniref:LysM peptidoglycan-binding domain-containing protein n=1 Tax=Archangium lipolyticum TaxID=2970465 RepID=UPI00214A79A9|nr:LysM domain-containing protein [Archangium lipolyticum]